MGTKVAEFWNARHEITPIILCAANVVVISWMVMRGTYAERPTHSIPTLGPLWPPSVLLLTSTAAVVARVIRRKPSTLVCTLLHLFSAPTASIAIMYFARGYSSGPFVPLWMAIGDTIDVVVLSVAIWFSLEYLAQSITDSV